METEEERKAKDLIAQFGRNARYVVLELIEECKYLKHPDSNFNSVLENRIYQLRKVKEIIDNKEE